MQKPFKTGSTRWLLLGIGTLVLSLFPVSHAAMAMDVDPDEQHGDVSSIDQQVCNETCASPTPCLEHCIQQAVDHKIEAIATPFGSVPTFLSVTTARPLFVDPYRVLERRYQQSRYVWRHRHLSTQAKE